MTELDDVLTNMRKQFNELTQSQKRIAEGIVADPEFVAFATVDKVAAKLGVSPSTIVRFAYRLGLNGYPELQELIRRRVRLHMRSNIEDPDPASILQNLEGSAAGRSFERDLRNLHRTASDIDLTSLEEAVTIVRDARRIYVAGYMASDSLAVFAALALARLHGNTYLLRNDGMQAAAVYEATQDDVFLVISFPPYASNSVAIADAARLRSAKVIAVTDSVISPVGQRGDVVLPAHVSGVSSQNSLVAPLAVLNALVNGIALESPNGLERYEQVMGSLQQGDAFILRDER